MCVQTDVHGSVKGSIPCAQPQSRPRAVFALGDNNPFYSASAFTNVLIST